MKLRSLSTMQLALAVSIMLHAALLTLRFAAPQTFNRMFEDTPMEVILVNARTKEAPDKARAIAQASLAGGGDADAGRATSPLPPSALVEQGDDVEQEAASKLQSLREQQALLLAQVKRQLAALPPPDPNETTNKPEDVEREEKRRKLIKLLAEIERRINQDNERPKRRYISPSAREEVYAVYYDALRRRIENRGTDNFPQSHGKKMYGELTMIVTVNHDGQVLGTEVVESSGNRTLDRHASAIVYAAGPFGRFSAPMRRQADQILVVSRFKFTRDETLEAALTSRR